MLRPAPDTLVGVTRHLVHPAFDQKADVFEPRLVELGLDLDRLTPDEHAATERPGEVEAIPAAQHAAPVGGKHDRHDRHAGETRHIDDTEAGLHRRAARPIRGDADAVARCELLQHEPQCRRSAAPGRAGDRVDAEIVHCIGDDPPVTMRRDQHVHRRQPLPRHRDHQQAAMPEGEDERLPGIAQPPRDLAALDGPAVGPVDEADIELDDPA